MSVIHQLYCTHCTFGSSALERGKGEMASRVLGYSARAASARGEDLRKQYRRVERFLYYSLPLGTPAEDRMRLADAAPDTPRRFFHYPSSDGFQIVGQIAWRQKDTSSGPSGGRYGCYFGHVLVWDSKAEPQSVLDCLSLCGAPWREEDNVDVGHDLPPLDDLGDLWPGNQPRAISREVLHSFLTAESPADFVDPCNVIPDRWKTEYSAKERQAIVGDTLGSYLETLANNRRESVLLVMEPKVAALVFFGVASLLPEGPIRDGLSFSTFEPNPDVLTTTLAATILHPSLLDLKPETYRGRSLVFNTFTGRKWNRAHVQSSYSELMMRKLLEDGWRAVDRTLGTMSDARPGNARELVELATIEPSLPLYLNPNGQAPAFPLRPSDAAARYIARGLADQVGRLHVGSDKLRTISADRQIEMLNLLAAAKDPKVGSAIQILSRNLCSQAPERMSALLTAAGVAPALKADLLVQYLRQEKRFPPQCESLWAENPPLELPQKDPSRADRAARTDLLSFVLGQFDDSVLKILATPGPTPGFLGAESSWEPLFLGLVRACAGDPKRHHVFARLVESVDDHVLLALLRDHGQELRTCYPRHEEQLQGRLRGFVSKLHECPPEFTSTLEVLWPWKEWFPEEAGRRLVHWRAAWDTFHAIREIREQERTLGGLGSLFGKRNDYREIASRLAGDLRNAMWGLRYEDRQTALWAVGQVLLDDPAFWKSRVPFAVESLLDEQLARHGLAEKLYVATSIESGSKKLLGQTKKAQRTILSYVTTAVALCVIFVVVYLAVSWGGSSVKRETEPEEPATAENEAVPAPAPKRKPADAVKKAPGAAAESKVGESRPAAAPQEKTPEPKSLPPDTPVAKAAKSDEATSSGKAKDAAEKETPDPHPGDSKPTAPVAKAQAEARTVDDFKPLPRIDVLAEDQYQPIVVTDLRAAKDIRLVLHGLATVNTLISGEPDGPFAVKEAQDKLGGLIVSLGDAGVEYGRFWPLSGRGVRFKWTAQPSTSDEQRQQLQWLSACILEVQGDTEPQFFALSERIVLPRVALVSHGSSQLAKSVDWDKPLPPAHPALHFPLVLGRGKVHWDDLEYDFAESAAEKADRLSGGLYKPRVVDPALVQRFSIAGVNRIEVTFAQEHAEGKPPLRFTLRACLTEDIEQQVETKIERGARLSQLFETLSAKDANKPGQVARFRVAAEETARLLGIKDVPAFPTLAKPKSRKSTKGKIDAVKENDANRKKYLQEVKAKLTDPARDEIVKLDKEIKELEKQRRDTDESKHLAERLKKLSGLSAVLYYELDGIRVNAVILGSPFE